MPEGPPLLATPPREAERRDSLRAARCVQLPVTSVDPVTGPSPELVVATVTQHGTLNGRRPLGIGQRTKIRLANVSNQRTLAGPFIG